MKPSHPVDLWSPHTQSICEALTPSLCNKSLDLHQTALSLATRLFISISLFFLVQRAKDMEEQQEHLQELVATLSGEKVLIGHNGSHRNRPIAYYTLEPI